MRIEQFCIQSHLMPPYLAGSLYLLAVNSLVNFPDKHCICRHKYKMGLSHFDITANKMGRGIVNQHLYLCFY